MLRIIPPTTIINDTEHVLQELVGEIDESTGLWQLKEEKFCVYLPYNDKGTVVKRYIPRELAYLLDWGKIQDKLLQQWNDNKLSGAEVENDSIEELLCRHGIMTETVNPNVIINGSPQHDYMPINEYIIQRVQESNEVIDITETANPRSEGRG